MKTWEERLFELIRARMRFVECKGGRERRGTCGGVGELNKSVRPRTLRRAGDFWQPVWIACGSRVGHRRLGARQTAAGVCSESTGEWQSFDHEIEAI